MRRPKTTHRRLAWITLALVIVALLAAVWFLPLRDWAQSFEWWIEGKGAAGVLLYAGLYVLACLLLLPAWILTVVAGAVFGLTGGFFVAMGSSLTGAVAAFLLARYAIRGRVEKFFERNALLHAVDKTLRKAGWKAIALMRLSPLVPFTVQNYFYGTTTLKLRHFVAGTALGIVPGTALEVLIGSSGRAALGNGGALHWALLACGIVATGVAAWYVGRVAKKKLGIRA
jgi:uncharacterized membrane protein YdjX (TVP38/TMEM64 family)